MIALLYSKVWGNGSELACPYKKSGRTPAALQVYVYLEDIVIEEMEIVKRKKSLQSRKGPEQLRFTLVACSFVSCRSRLVLAADFGGKDFA